MSDDNSSKPVGENFRRILTFMKRSSPLTTSQKLGLEQFSERYLMQRAPFDAQKIFGRDAPLTLEIGFGMGQSLVAMAEAAPDRNFIGIEVHHPGVAQILFEAGQKNLGNLRIYEDDALQILDQDFADGSIDTLQLFFPDPWQKKKHHKRRLVNPENVELIRRKLKTGGIFHMATDWQPYAEWMLEIMEAAPGYENTAGKGLYSPRPEHRPETKFEKRGVIAGHGVWDLLYRKT